MDALLSRSGVRQGLTALTRVKQVNKLQVSLRSYSDVKKDAENDALMEQLRQQHLEEEERTSMSALIIEASFKCV